MGGNGAVCGRMGVAKALLNAVFQQLVEIPRERRVKQCKNGVCVCNGGNREQEKGIYDMDSLAL